MAGAFYGKYARQYSARKTMNLRLAKARVKGRALATKSFVKHAIMKSDEANIFDFTYGSANISSAGNVLKTVQDMTRGDLSSNRTGDQITPYSMELNTYIKVSTSQTGILRVRYIVFIDNDRTGLGTPTVADILETVSVLSPIDADNYRTKRFKILSDKIMSIGPSVLDPNNTHIIRHHFTNLPKMSWTVGNVASRGQLYIFALSDSAASAPLQPELQYYGRLLYKD